MSTGKDFRDLVVVDRYIREREAELALLVERRLRLLRPGTEPTPEGADIVALRCAIYVLRARRDVLLKQNNLHSINSVA